MRDRTDGLVGDQGEATPVEGSAVETPNELFPSSTSDLAPASEQSQRRRQALSLNLTQLEETRRQGFDLRRTLDGIELNEWEFDQLAEGLDESAKAWQSLVVEGVALRNKLVTDLGWVMGSGKIGPEEAAEINELLIADAALGIALVAETQQAINQLILVGEINEAKKLTNFRTKIAQSLAELRPRVGEDGFSTAQELSEGFITPNDRASWTRRTGDSAGQRNAVPRFGAKSQRPTGAVVRVVSGSEETGSSLKPLMVLLGVLVMLWAALILPRLTAEPLPVLKLRDVTPRAEIRHVVARPPSLFVQLDARMWQALSREGRLALVDDVGRTAASAGYHGVNFTVEDGRTAAQWLKERGSELVD